MNVILNGEPPHMGVGEGFTYLTPSYAAIPMLIMYPLRLREYMISMRLVA